MKYFSIFFRDSFRVTRIVRLELEYMKKGGSQTNKGHVKDPFLERERERESGEDVHMYIVY